jgi:putative Mn2+ efflux pump MntP
MHRVPFKLAALVVPLSLDTFAVAAALGLAGFSRRDRWRISLTLAGFEAAMPMVGFFAGAALGHAVGGVAGYVAAAVLIGAGGLMLREESAYDGTALAARARGFAIVGLGISVSVDELAIGFAIGLLRLPLLLVVALIAAHAVLAGQLGPSAYQDSADPANAKPRPPARGEHEQRGQRQRWDQRGLRDAGARA